MGVPAVGAIVEYPATSFTGIRYTLYSAVQI